MVECLVWDQDAAGSSPVTSTISSIHKGFHFMNTRFFYHDTVLCTEQAVCLLLLLRCFRLGEIFYGNVFTGAGNNIPSVRYFGYFHIPDKTVIYDDSLGSVFSGAFCFKYINMVDQFPQ